MKPLIDIVDLVSYHIDMGLIAHGEIDVSFLYAMQYTTERRTIVHLNTVEGCGRSQP